MADAGAVSPPTVAFIVPAWNAAATIAETLVSIAAQTFPNWEAVVVDDGSTDDTGAIVGSWCARDSRFRHVRSAKCATLAAVRNRGVAETEARWLVFLDADDLIAPEFVHLALSVAHADPEADLVYPARVFRAADGRSSAPDKGIGSDDPFRLMLTGAMFSVMTLLRRSAFNRIGGFDASLTTCEDWDLWLRLARSGSRFRLLDRPLATVRMVPGSLSRRNLDRMFADYITVARRARQVDPRVADPLPQWRLGAPDTDLPRVCAATLARMGAVAVAGGGDPAALFAVEMPKQARLELAEDDIAWLIRGGLCEGAAALASDFAPLWRRWRGGVAPFLARFAAHVNAEPGFDERLIRLLDDGAGAESVAAGPRQAFESAHLAMCQALSRSARLRPTRGGEIDFCRGGNAGPHRLGGWTAPEPWGSWTEGQHVQIILAIKPHRGRSLRLDFEIGNVHVAPTWPRLSIEVLANGRHAAGWDFAETGPASRSLFLSPAQVGEGGTVLLALLIDTPTSPLALGASQDPRLLGICLRKVVYRMVTAV